MKDYYKVLGLPRNASATQIKQAYRNLVKQCHPDVNSSQKAVEWTRQLNEAYSVLADANAKASYDMDLKLEEAKPKESSAGQRQSSQSKTGNSPPPRPVPNFNCEKCGRVDSSLRVSATWRVVSVFVFSRKSPTVKLLCCKCRAKESLAANAFTVLVGWWSVVGFFWTLEALFKNASGGDQPRENNAALLKALSYQLYRGGNEFEAYRALVAAIKFQPDPEGEKILEQLQQKINPTERKTFWERLHSFELHPFFYHAPAGAVCLVLLLFGLHALSATSDSGPYYPAQRPPRPYTQSPSQYPDGHATSSSTASLAVSDAMPVFSEPEEPLPKEGLLTCSADFASNTNETAPFKISTPWDGNYVMKIEDWNTKEFVATYFIRRNSALSIELPLGTYQLKFAEGDKWYGTKYLFGPTTAYSYVPDKMDFYISGDYAQGHEIQLIPQVNGNLVTPSMPARDW